MNQLYTILGTTIVNIIVFVLYQGFVHSYWGKNMREEITRFFNRFKKEK
jgi:low affinity Fe/Cu permease